MQPPAYRLAALLLLLAPVAAHASGLHVPSPSRGTATTPALIVRAKQQLQLTAVSFADSRDGWVAAYTGYHDYVLHTVNAGRTWMRYPVGFGATQMQFIDATRGWAIGTVPLGCFGPRAPCQNLIAFTGNGGRSWVWQLRAGRCWQLSSLDFADAADGWAVERNWSCLTRPSQQEISRVIRTTDGGRTWHVVFTMGAAAGSVHFGDRLHGWFAGGGIGTNHCSTTVFQTIDGGLHWRRQIQVPGYCSPSVDFVDDQNGWLLATDWGMCSMGGCYDNRLYRSQDGGRSWRLERRASRLGVPALWSGPSGFLGAVLFVTPQVGYIPVSEGAGPGQGGIDITRDGGRYWVRDQPYRSQVSSLSPVNAAEAWVVGCPQPDGTCRLLHTVDAGRSWQLVHIYIGAPEHRVARDGGAQGIDRLGAELPGHASGSAVWN